jgi:hypothetical protein
MEATNKTNMDAMMEQMNAFVVVGGARHAHQPDKVNTPPGSNVIPLGSGARAKKHQAKESPLSQLQMLCNAQAGQLFQA